MAEAWTLEPLRALIEKPIPGSWGEDSGGTGLEPVRVVRNGDAASHYTLSGKDLPERWMHPSDIARAECRVGDILLASSGDVGAVARLDDTGNERVVASNFVRRVRAREGVDTRWLFFLLQTSLAHDVARRCSGGTTLQNLSSRFFDEFLAPAPPSCEQLRIAEILNTVDDVITLAERTITKLGKIKHGLLHDLLTRGVDEKGEVRPVCEERPDLYGYTTVGAVPTSWEVGRLDLFAVRGSGHTPNKNVPSYWNGGIKWVSLADSDRLDDLFIYDTDKEVSELGIANSSAVKHPKGTVILSRDAGVGKSAILGSTMAVSQHFMAWKCGRRLNNVYLYYWLQHTKPRFEAIAMGSTIKTIGLPYFKNLDIAIPPRWEQDTVASRLLDADGLLQSSTRTLAKLRLLRRGLLDDLLTGRVRVTINDASAG